MWLLLFVSTFNVLIGECEIVCHSLNENIGDEREGTYAG